GEGTLSAQATFSVGYVDVAPTMTLRLTGLTFGLGLQTTNNGTVIFDAPRFSDGGTLTDGAGTVVLNADAGTVDRKPSLLVMGANALLQMNASQHLNTLSISLGRAALAPGGSRVLSLGSLLINSTAALDLADNAMIF